MVLYKGAVADFDELMNINAIAIGKTNVVVVDTYRVYIITIQFCQCPDT